jgi:hypothetical protein
MIRFCGRLPRELRKPVTAPVSSHANISVTAGILSWAVPVTTALVAAALAAGQNPPQSRILGEVTAVDAAGKSLTVKSDKGDVTAVVLDEKTLYLRVPPGEKDLKNASRISLAEISAGDRVLARGQMSADQKSISAGSVIVMTKADLAKKHEHDREEWQRRGITGTITALNPEAREFTVSVRTREGAQPLVVERADSVDLRRYAPDSVRFMDATPSSFAELRTGDHVRVLGEKNAEGTRLKPEAIVSGSFRNIAGMILAVDTAANEIRITDLDTKKPVIVRVNSDTSLRRLPPMAATMLARRMNPQAVPAAGAGPRIDFNQVLERTPVIPLSELKPGEAIIISSTTGADPGRVTAITLVAGVEPMLTAAPAGERGQLGGAWTFDMGLPQ